MNSAKPITSGTIAPLLVPGRSLRIMPSAALQVTCSARTVFLFVGPTLGVYFAVGEGRILSLTL